MLIHAHFVIFSYIRIMYMYPGLQQSNQCFVSKFLLYTLIDVISTSTSIIIIIIIIIIIFFVFVCFVVESVYS